MKGIYSPPSSSAPMDKKIRISLSEVETLIRQEVERKVKKRENRLRDVVNSIRSLEEEVDYENTIQRMEAHVYRLTKRAELVLKQMSETQIRAAKSPERPQENMEETQQNMEVTQENTEETRGNTDETRENTEETQENTDITDQSDDNADHPQNIADHPQEEITEERQDIAEERQDSAEERQDITEDTEKRQDITEERQGIAEEPEVIPKEITVDFTEHISVDITEDITDVISIDSDSDVIEIKSEIKSEPISSLCPEKTVEILQVLKSTKEEVQELQVQNEDINSSVAIPPVVTARTPGEYPPFPSLPGPSGPNKKASSFSLPPKLEVHLALIRAPLGLSVLWKVSGEDSAAPPMSTYSIFVSTEKTKGGGDFPDWQLLNEVKAMPLPMCVMVNKYKPEFKLYIVVVGKDTFNRFGAFSNVVTAIVPKTK